MALVLRDYQQQAVDATVHYFRHRRDPALIVLPTGAGKSVIIAELARIARGRVLVLAHVQELVTQNLSKFQQLGMDAGCYSAGLGRKEHVQKVIFASVQSVVRNPAHFESAFSLLIIDECHRISPAEQSQYQRIITQLRRYNPALSILGLTATPFRLDSGWIYQFHYHGMVRGTPQSPFRDCIYELPLHYLIKQGFLVAPKVLDMPLVHYDFSALVANQHGLFCERDIDQQLKQQRRITPRIVQQLVDYAATRQGVMIFAATVKHAYEVFGYLPKQQSGIITAQTPTDARSRMIAAFKQQQLKYLVNVAVLTTGFDAPHVDMIAILRPTESVSLYQQIVGRGLRPYPGKKCCLILDYAANPHHLFAPEVGDRRQWRDTVPVQVFCPLCRFANTFWGKTAADGSVIEHFGRRCHGIVQADDQRQQCDFRFRFKLCPACGAENDIASRDCYQCDHILVDADDQLKAALALKNTRIIRCAGMVLEAQRQANHTRLKATYYDEDGTCVSEHFSLDTPQQRDVFHQHFMRIHQRAPGIKLDWLTAQDVQRHQAQLRHPDFVIVRVTGARWEVREKLFDYQGQFRLANQLR